MQFYDIVQDAATNKGIAMDRIGLAMGRSSSYISAARSRGSLPKVDNAAEILDVCGYVLCAIPKDAAPKNAMIVDAHERS